MGRRRIVQQFQHRQGGDRFAGTRFAHQSNRLALIDMKRYAAHRMDDLAVNGEIDMQIIHFQQRPDRLVLRHVRSHQENVFLGSNASRTASPTKISRLSISEITKNPVSASHGA